MSNSKYVKNRNNWRRVYPRTRQKPRLLSIVEPTGVSASIDLTRQLRTRDYFEYLDPISGSLVIPPGPVLLFPQCTNLNVSGGVHYFANDSYYLLTGSDVGVWRGISSQNEDTGEVDFGVIARQEATASQPTPVLLTSLSGTNFTDVPFLDFDGDDWLDHDDPNYANFMHLSGTGNDTGGTAISVIQLPENLAVRDYYIWSMQNGIFSRGPFLRLRTFGGSSMRFEFGMVNTGLETWAQSLNYVIPVSRSLVTLICRSLPASNTTIFRVQGHTITRAGSNAWASTDGGFNFTIGKYAAASSNFFSGSIHYLSVFPRILTDDECVCVENWVASIFGASGTLQPL